MLLLKRNSEQVLTDMGKKPQTMVLLAMAKNSSFCIRESCGNKWTQTHTLTRTGCGRGGEVGMERAGGQGVGGMETWSRKHRSGLQESSEEPHPVASAHSGSRLNTLSYHIIIKSCYGSIFEPSLGKTSSLKLHVWKHHTFKQCWWPALPNPHLPDIVTKTFKPSRTSIC